MHIHCVSKNVLPLTCYNADIRDQITNFWQSITKKVRSQTMFYFPTSPALPCETGNPEIASFHLNTVCWFANEHTKHLNYHLVAAELPFISKRDRLYASDN